MLPRKLPDAESARGWRVVRLDTHEFVKGRILSADADTGECVAEVPDPYTEKPTEVRISVGANGLAIIRGLVLALMVGGILGGCAGGIAPPDQPTPVSILAVIDQIAPLQPAGPLMVWEAGDYGVRAGCDAYLNSQAQRASGIGLASSGLGMGGVAAAGILAAGGNPGGAALAGGLASLAQSFLGAYQAAGSMPYSNATVGIVQDAMDAYEGAVATPATVAEAMMDVEGLWFRCTPAGYAELAMKAISTASVTAGASPAFLSRSIVGQPVFPPPRPRPPILVNGR